MVISEPDRDLTGSHRLPLPNSHSAVQRRALEVFSPSSFPYGLDAPSTPLVFPSLAVYDTVRSNRARVPGRKSN
jgi:hypothetical protein